MIKKDCILNVSYIYMDLNARPLGLKANALPIHFRASSKYYLLSIYIIINTGHTNALK